MPFDLFGQVPVTWPEVFDWVERVAGIPADSPRAAAYIQQWDVAAKVARSKVEADQARTPGRPHSTG